MTKLIIFLDLYNEKNQIKAYLKSVDKESEVVSMKFDFIENVDIYQVSIFIM